MIWNLNKFSVKFSLFIRHLHNSLHTPHLWAARKIVAHIGFSDPHLADARTPGHTGMTRQNVRRPETQRHVRMIDELQLLIRLVILTYSAEWSSNMHFLIVDSTNGKPMLFLSVCESPFALALHWPQHRRWQNLLLMEFGLEILGCPKKSQL